MRTHTLIGRGARLLVRTGTIAIGGLLLAAPSAGAATEVLYFPNEGGTSIQVDGEANDDAIAITLADNTITIADTGTGGITTVAPECATAGATAVTCPLDSPDPAPPAAPTGPVFAVGVSLLEGNDSAASAVPLGFFANGGLGDDVLTGGPGDDDLVGDHGNDSLRGGDGDDFLNGGGFGFSTGGTDVLDGESGVDSASYFRDGAVNVSLDGQPNDGFAGEGDNVIAEQVESGDGDDVLTGNAGANRLDGNDGNDLLSGLEGNDVLDGGAGDDGLVGGPQRDDLWCGDSFDTATVDPRDSVGAECERTGAEVEGGTATVSRKGRTRVLVECPAEEANPCTGQVVLFARNEPIGEGAFALGPNTLSNVRVKLSKAGKKLLDASRGTLLATAEAQTSEPIGTTIAEDAVFLVRAGGR